MRQIFDNGRIAGRRMMVTALLVSFLTGGVTLAQDAGEPAGANGSPAVPTTRPNGAIKRYRGSADAMRSAATRPAHIETHQPDEMGLNPGAAAELKTEAAELKALDDARLEALKARARSSTRPSGASNQPALPPRLSPPLAGRKPPPPGGTPVAPSHTPGSPSVMPASPDPAVPPSEPVPIHPEEVNVEPEPAPATPLTPESPVPAGAPGHAPGTPTTIPSHAPAGTHRPPVTPPPGAPGGAVNPAHAAAPAVVVDTKTDTAVPKLDPKTYWKLPHNERPYFFNWSNTPLEKCCQDFVEMSGLSMIGLDTVIDGPDGRKKPVTFQSLELQDFDQALTRFNLITQEIGLGYWTMVRDGYLEIRQLSEWYRRMPAERLYTSEEAYRKAKLPGWEMASMLYVPRHQPAARLAQWFNDSVPDNCARATLFPDSNQIEIRGGAYYIDRGLEILAVRDVPPDDGRIWVTYELKYQSPAEVSSQLQNILIVEGLMGGAAMAPGMPSPQPQPQQPGVPTPPGRSPRVTPRPPSTPVEIGVSSGDDISIIESANGNTLMVMASPTKHERIAEIIKEVDVPAGTQQKIKILQLQHVDPSTMIDLVTPLLGEPRIVQPQAPPAKPGQPQPPPPPPTVMKMNTRATLQVSGPTSILVKADDKEMAEIENLIKMLDVPSEEAKYQVVKLQHADASSVAMVLQNVISGRSTSTSRRMSPMGSPAEGFKVVPDNTTDRTLVLSGNKQDIEEARKLIAELDVNPTEGAAEHIVQLKNAEPASVVQILTTRFGGSSSGGSFGRRGYGGYGGYGGGGAGHSLPQFIPDDESKMLIVICHDESWPDINKLITELDERSETLKTTRSYQLKHASAESVSMLLSEALGAGSRRSRGYGFGYGGSTDKNQPSFLVNSNTNLLMVTATEEDHVKAADLIKQLDQPSPTDMAEFRPIDLEKADAEYVAEKIEEVIGGESSSSRRRSSGYYNPWGGGYGGGGGDSAPKVPVRVIAETMGNRVLVQASDEDFKKAEDLARQIDAEYAKLDIVRKTFVLENTDAWDAQQIITSMFDAQSAGGSRGRYSSSYFGGSDSPAPGGVKIAPTGNGLVVQAPKDKMAEIEKFIAELDKNPTAGNEVKMYKVKTTGYEGSYGVARALSTMLGVPDASSRWSQSSTKSPIKIIGDYGSNVLFVSAPKDKMPEIDKKVQEYLDAQSGGDTTMIIRHFVVNKARPQDVADVVQPILDTKYREMQEQGGSRRGGYYGGWYGSSGGPEITVNKITRNLMVMAPAELMTTVEELIKEFDREGQASITRMVNLKTAKADDIVPIVQDHMKASAGSSGSGRRSSSRYRSFEYGGYGGWGGYGGSSSRSEGSDDLMITAFESSNSIILRGTEDRVYEAEKFIMELDAKAIPEGPMIKVVQLKHADPYTVSDAIDEMAGGGSSGSDYLSGSGSTRRVSSSSSAITVKTDYASKRLIIAALPEKYPLIEQIIELHEALAAGDEIDKPGGQEGGAIILSNGDMRKFYDVKGPSKEIADQLDKILYGLIGYDAPFVKSFPYTNQVVITGDPKYFKTAEEWLAKLEKNPPPVKLVVVARKPSVSPGKVVEQLGRLAPTSFSGGVKIRRVEGSSTARDPMSMLKEIRYDTPIEEQSPATRPAVTPPQIDVVSQYVPSGELAAIERSLAALTLMQAPIVRRGTTQPSTTRPAVVPTVASRPAATPKITPQPAPAAPAEPPVGQQKPANQAKAGQEQPKGKPNKPAAPAADPSGGEPTAEQRMMAEVYQAAADVRTSSQPQILYDEQQGTIIVIGQESQVEELSKLLDTIIEEIDKLEGAARADIRVFGVNYIDVTVAASILETLFNEGAPGGKGAKAPKTPAARKPPTPKAGAKGAKAGEEEEEESAAAERRREEEEAAAKEAEAAAQAAAAGSIKVLPDPRTGTLIIKAASETFPKIAEVLLKIDRPGSGPGKNIKIFQLKRLNAGEVEEVLKEILKIDSTRGRTMMRPRISGRGLSGMAGGAGVDASMIDALEQQMLDLQQTMIATNAPNGGAEGEGKDGKTKINPSKDISIASDSTTNSIIVTAPEEGMKLVETLINKIEELDIPIRIQTVQLEFADADKVATQLKDVFESQRRGGGGFDGMRGGMSSAGSRTGDFKVSADARTNRLVIRALDPDMERIISIVKELDSAPTSPVKIYSLHQASAEDLTKTLNDMYGSTASGGGQAVRITADRSTNSILVRAQEAQHLLIAAKIKELDEQTGTISEVRQIQLKVATATTVSSQLTKIFTPKGSSKGLRQQIMIEGDDASRMLFVTCPPEMFAEIQKIAEQMDKTSEQTVQVTKLTYAAATDILPKLNEMAVKLIAASGLRGSSDAVFAATADERTNSLVIVGSPKAIVVVDSVVKQLDVKPSDTTAQTTQMFPLNRGNAASVATTINSLYGSKRWQAGVEAPKAAPDSTANVVFVTGTAAQLELIKTQLIDPLEGYNVAKPVDVAVNDYEITVTFADVEELATKLTTMFAQRIQARKAAGDTSLTPLETALSIVPEPSTRKLFVSCSQDTKKKIDDWLKGLDVEGVSIEGQQTKVLPVRFADLTYTSNALNTAFTKIGRVPASEQVKIVPEYGTNSIIVKALKKDVDKIEQLLADIDRDDRDRLIAPEAIQIQHVLPSQMANRLTLMIRSTYAVDRRTGQYPVSVEANDTGGTILVTAKSKQAMDSIKELIAKLDSRPAEDERSIKPYVLQFADLVSTMNIIMKRFGKQELLPLRDQVAIEIDYTTGALLVTASEERHAEVAKIIGDVDNSEVVSIKLPETIKVNNVLPTQLASRLNTMIQQSKRRDRRTGLFPVTVTPDDNAGTLLVTANKTDMQETKELIAKLDIPPEKDPRTVKAFVMKYADPTSMQNIILKRFKGQELRPLKDQVAIEFDYSTSSMLVTGSEENQAEVAKILTEMDNPSIVDIKVPETIKVRHVRASQLATTLTQMIQATKRRDKRTGLFPVTVNGDDNANTLLVTANKLDMEEMKRLIEQLDIPIDTSDDRIMKVYAIKFADPSVARQIIVDQFKGTENRPMRDQVAAGFDYTTSTVMVTASEENHNKVQTLIDTFDKSDVAARKTYPVELKNGDPEDAAQTLSTLYANAFPRTRTGRMPAVFTAVPGSRKLLVTCTPGEFEEAKALIDQLDVSAQTGDQKRAMRVVQVKKLPAREMMTMLTEYLRKPGKSGMRDSSLQDDIKVTASDTADAVVLTGPEERLDELQQLIEKVDASVADSSDPNAGGRQYAVIPLTNADPSSVAQLISQTYQSRGNVPESEKVTAVAERATNSVVISAGADKLEKIRKMIDELDQQSANVPQQEIIRLTNARAEDLVDVLKQTYQSSRRGGGSGPPISFAPDSNGNAIVVSAGKADLEGIKTMVQELDKPATDNAQEMRIIPLQFVDADETLTILSEYLRKPGSSAGRRGAGTDLLGGIRLQASATLNALIASGSSAELDRVQKIALDMDKHVQGAGAPKIIEVKNTTAATLAATLTTIFTEPAKQQSRGRTDPESIPLITFDEAANSLIVRARPMDFTLIEDMVKQLDKEPQRPTGIEVITVSRGMNVVELATQIQKLINDGERAKKNSQKGYVPREVAIAGEERSSSLIVSGSPELFDTVKKLAADLDKKRGDTGGRRALVVPVKTKSASDIQKVLDQFIEQQNGKRR